MVNQGLFIAAIVLSTYVANTNAFLGFVYIPKVSMNQKTINEHFLTHFSLESIWRWID